MFVFRSCFFHALIPSSSSSQNTTSNVTLMLLIPFIMYVPHSIAPHLHIFFFISLHHLPSSCPSLPFLFLSLPFPPLPPSFANKQTWAHDSHIPFDISRVLHHPNRL